MKKAKEYAKEFEVFISSPKMTGDKINSEIVRIFNEFQLHTMEIAKVRNVQTSRGICNVLKEQNIKWNAMCDRLEAKDINCFKKDGFKRLAVKEFRKMIPGLQVEDLG